MSRAILRRGDKGPDVTALQVNLQKAGYYAGHPVDGDYGRLTYEAVLDFQEDRPEIGDDGVYGPLTRAALERVVAQLPTSQPKPVEIVPWTEETRSAWIAFVTAIVNRPAKYGPGRGLFIDGKFIVTLGPGALNLRNWRNFEGKPYPSFHCTSLVNFGLAWLLRYNERFTHAGNIPDLLTELLVNDDALHPIFEDGRRIGQYRGYGQACSRLIPDGSGAARQNAGVRDVFDAREIYERRASMPTFIAWGQSTKIGGKWRWWHHTGFFVIDHRDNHRMYRFAADGINELTGRARGYSATPLRYTEVNEKTLPSIGNTIYRAFGVDTLDGSYGDQTKPIAAIDFESV